MTRYRVTLKEQYSSTTQTVIAEGDTPEQAGMNAMRQNPGWTAQHSATVPESDVTAAEAALVAAQQAVTDAETSHAEAEARAADAVAAKESAADAVDQARVALDEADAALVTAKKVAAEPVVEVSPAVPAPPAPPAPGTAKMLRTDGPTFEEWVAQGYDPAAYPPQGFAEKSSAGWTQYLNDQTKPK